MARAARSNDSTETGDTGEDTAETAPGYADPDPEAESSTPDDLALGGGLPPVASLATAGAIANEASVVNARDGLNLRSGPGVQFQPPLRLLPLGFPLHVVGRSGDWAQVDLQGDGAADGFVLAAFLKPAGASTAVLPAPALLQQPDTFRPLTSPVLQTIMDRCAGMHINTKLNLGQVVDALNRSMLLAEANTVLREVAFLSQAVIETDYFRTFKEYGEGRGKDYYPYYGRGIHQLTWRDTYASCSKAIFGDDRLSKDPDLILKDIEVNIKATAWFWKDYKKLNRFADTSNIDEIIHRLYGGRITSPNPQVRKSVILRRGYYTTIMGIVRALR